LIAGTKDSGGFNRLFGLSFLQANFHHHGALQSADPNASDILHDPNERGEQGWTMVRRSTTHSESANVDHCQSPEATDVPER
jgi:hypothetical protein